MRLLSTETGPGLILGDYLPASAILSLRVCCQGFVLAADAWKRAGILARRVLRALASNLAQAVADEQELATTFERNERNERTARRFCECLQSRGAIISGSFVLRALEGDSWSFGDLDVFLLLQANLGEQLADILSIPADRILVQRPDWSPRRTGRYRRVHHIETINIKIHARPYQDLTIEILHLLPESVSSPAQHLEQFDVGFCKNSFDGCSLIVYDVLSLRTRSTVLKVRERDYQFDMVTRICKYETRGFSFRELTQQVVTFDKDGLCAPVVLLFSGAGFVGPFMECGQDIGGFLAHLVVDWLACLKIEPKKAALPQPAAAWRGLIALPYVVGFVSRFGPEYRSTWALLKQRFQLIDRLE